MTVGQLTLAHRTVARIQGLPQSIAIRYPATTRPMPRMDAQTGLIGANSLFDRLFNAAGELFINVFPG